MLTPQERRSGLVCCIEDEGDDGEGVGGEDTPTGGFDENMRNEMTKMVNQVVSSQFKRGFVQEMIGSAVKDSIASALKAQMPSASATGAKNLSPDPESKSSAPSNGTGDRHAAGAPEEFTARLADYDRRVKQLQEQLAQQQESAKSEKQNALRSEERSRLEHELRSNGIPDERLRGAVALLYTEDSRVSRDSDGNILFTVQRDGYTDDLPLSKGVSEWVNGPEGKIYLPPKDVGGSGTKTNRPQRGVKGKETRMEMMARLGSQLMNE